MLEEKCDYNAADQSFQQALAIVRQTSGPESLLMARMKETSACCEPTRAS